MGVAVEVILEDFICEIVLTEKNLFSYKLCLFSLKYHPKA